MNRQKEMTQINRYIVEKKKQDKERSHLVKIRKMKKHI